MPTPSARPLAEHTFRCWRVRRVLLLARLRQRQGHRRRRRSRRAGAPPRPATSRTSSPRPPSPSGFGVKLLRGPARRRRPALEDQPAAEVVPRHLSRLHRPRPRGDAGRRAGAGADRQEGLRAQGRRPSTSSVLAAAERALQPDLQLRLAGDRRGLLLRHVRVDGREPEDDGPGRRRPRHLRSLRQTCATQMHDTLQTFGASTFEVQDMCTTMNVRLSETGQAINEMAESASRVAEGVRTPGRRRRPGPQRRRAGLQRRRDRDPAQPHRHRRRDGRHRRFE